MTGPACRSGVAGGAALLERALGYALGTVQAVTPQALCWPTPCSEWDLRALLHHVNDSLDVLHEAIGTGRIDVRHDAPASDGARIADGRSTHEPVTRGPSTDPGSTLGPPLAHGDPPIEVVTAFRTRAGRLLGAWAAGGASHRLIAVGGAPLAANVVAFTGAVEVAVHGWDIARACGNRRPIPSLLAAEMLDICAVILTGSSRRPLFAAPVEVSPRASPSDRLVAFLGRDPGYGCE